ncbi:MAG: zincin-like metallopeptidase domain-containing protein [Phycisphaera sp.]|nr:MAG: zincin-like metallopeptidase domain-containing protein [Phycisphaera sp.]
MALDVYTAVTGRIIELLDRGTVPWRHPIRGAGGEQSLPTSLASQRAYRGINVFLLAVTAWLEGYESPYWLTYVQARKMGGHVRKGEKGSLVILWKQYATQDKETGEDITVPVLRHYTVFNAEQCEGIEVPSPATAEDQDEKAEFTPIEAAAAIVEHYEGGPRIEHKGSRALYQPKADLVRIADPDRFVDPESYYATLFHELVHSTGHSSRLDRGLDENLSPFGSADYSKEELVAEMGAAFLAAASGIGQATIDQSAAYIDGWRKKLSSDTKLVVQAAGAAQKAADWVLGDRPSHP